MFTRQELKSNNIDRRHFIIVNQTVYYLELKSMSTGHSWLIYSKQLDTKHRSLVINHMHHDGDAYHEQIHMHPRSIKQAQAMIINHDRWHLNGRKHK